jgi:hypothetical protein
MPRNDPRFDGLAPVTCESCGAGVLVAKFSREHTSVQWDAAAVAACLEFDGPSPLNPGCDRLRASIRDAVARGRLTVAPP